MGVSRMTRPVRILTRGRQAGQAATLQCLAEQVTGCLPYATDGPGRRRASGLCVANLEVYTERSFSGRCRTISRCT